jgi:hypothetical protein
MIVPIANYQTSRDYRQLWTLAQTAAIVCIVDFQPGKPRTCRDIASTIHSPEYSPELVQVSSRGIGHIWAESVESFIAQCEHCNLEWLVPPGAPSPLKEELDLTDRLLENREQVLRAIPECPFKAQVECYMHWNGLSELRLVLA